jgi:hypothetical protein
MPRCHMKYSVILQRDITTGHVIFKRKNVEVATTIMIRFDFMIRGMILFNFSMISSLSS